MRHGVDIVRRSIACAESQIARLAVTEDAEEGLKAFPRNANRLGPVMTG
jgi:hypothetical protein